MAKRRSFVERGKSFRRELAQIWDTRKSLRLAVFEEKPENPPLAYFFRRYQTFSDAVRAWGADRSGDSSDERECQRWRCDAAERIRVALGNEEAPDYAAARSAIDDWGQLHDPNRICGMVTAEDPAMLAGTGHAALVYGIAHQGSGELRGVRVSPFAAEYVVAAELENLLGGLLVAYSDPAKFLCEFAPTRFPDDFLPDQLPLALWTWGLGALTNPTVLAAFQAANPTDLIEVLACAEGREKYREGRKKARDKAARRRRVDNVETKRQAWEIANRIDERTGGPRGAVKRAVAILARREGKKPSAIRRRISRASHKK